MHILTQLTDAMMGETNLRADLLFKYCITFLKFNIGKKICFYVKKCVVKFIDQ